MRCKGRRQNEGIKIQFAPGFPSPNFSFSEPRDDGKWEMEFNEKRLIFPAPRSEGHGHTRKRSEMIIIALCFALKMKRGQKGATGSNFSTLDVLF